MGMNFVNARQVSDVMERAADFAAEVDAEYDVHTITVIIDNGHWVAKVEATDDDMDDIVQSKVVS